MKSRENTMHGQHMLAFKEANISKVAGLSPLLASFTKRITVSYSSSSTVQTYRRALRDISLFHGCLPNGLETDEILDYLHFLKEKGLSWAKIKLDAAGLKYFYREMAGDEKLASSIPYPKEEKSLPLILSRKELLRLFDAAPNPKHRVILRLIYGSGLRRSELINLRIKDVETDDGKCRLRINKSKGCKDRYTVLSQKVLTELRAYFKACRPKESLFNGQKKGQPMSRELLPYIMEGCLKRSGIKKEVSLHTLRHCRIGGPICFPCP
ncbi:tyrosine-type recombinase/integrase [Nafulsella turpanensis]|uniref:tyrosine-type recombinase/integrase n=1 Tax=Nafulsella turpanensis TaxID=1265690 RepID=UPI00034B39F8|nr:tyrosine-type recombinase/integrase [Nafulsella turpanensis]